MRPMIPGRPRTRSLPAAAMAMMLLGAIAPMPGAAAQDDAGGEVGSAGPVPGVTFDATGGAVYAPVRALAERLGLPVHWDADARAVYLGDAKVPAEHLVRLPGTGRRAVALGFVRDAGLAAVAWDQDSRTATLRAPDAAAVPVAVGEKRVEVNRDAQELRAYQGDLLVFETRVSTGRPGQETPKGYFEAGPLKTRMLISRTYGDAKMPYSVQVKGDYVIHGFPSVPPRAASHGCVRLPLTGPSGLNPARWFYQWVDVGTPVYVADGWPNRAASRERLRDRPVSEASS